MSYTELQITTNFSFLRGGSHPQEIVERALALGYKEIAITDRNTLAGIVRAHIAARDKDIRIIPACRLDLADGTSLLAYPTDKAAYARLSALLTKGNWRTEKGKCELTKKDVFEHAPGIKFIVIPPVALDANYSFDEQFIADLHQYKEAIGDNLYLGAIRYYQAYDGKVLHRLQELSHELSIPMVATNDVHYHSRERRELQDVLTCVREKCTIYNAGYKLHQNAERYLKPIPEMKRLFRQYPDALERTKEIANACRFSLDELEYVYPEEITTGERTPQEELIYLTWKGAKEKLGERMNLKLKETIQFELDFIERKNYAAYFLTVYDFVRYAREKQILCQGRGSAANSVVCYCLGITSVDPSKFSVLFARFMSDARNEPPDIDVDFEHERREEVIQYIYEKYGRDRAAIVATVTEVHYKGAVRDVAKAMGLSVDTINLLANASWEFTDEWHNGRHVSGDGFDASDPHLKKVLDLTSQYIGFPRQLGQHTGGFVMTRGKLSDLCPILNARMEGRTCIEWNKDDIEALGFLKVDVLALGMLTCIRKAFDLVKQHYDLDLTLAKINEKDDPNVYDMICRGDTIGVFQIESRAQMSMLPRLKPRKFYDLVIEVAIVRPGPIQGDMVHPYLRRREGKDPVEYPKEELKKILERTLGVPLFQEQAMQIAIDAAGFTDTEADGLRRSMATFKAKGKVSEWHRKLVGGMVERGYTEEFANRVFKQLEGFGSYGFPESHAASFALLVYVSSWLKCYYPDIFAAALLNSQPMGFYQPAQIVTDARNHGVECLPVDINHSQWDNILEERTGKYCPLRLGFRQVKGMNEEDVKLLLSARSSPFTSIPQLRDAGVTIGALEKLANADAFRSIGLDRRQALWEVSALGDRPTGIYTGQQPEAVCEQGIQLPLMALSEHVVHDYNTLSLSLKAHPLSFVREKLSMLGVTPTKDIALMKDGDPIKVAGLVLVRQRPGTAKGICFITLEDEGGIANLVVFEKLFDAYRKEILQSRLLMVEGKLQVEGKENETKVIHVVVKRCFNLNKLMYTQVRKGLPSIAMSRADEKSDKPDPRTVTKTPNSDVFYKGRNFR
ncbi:MAG: error-prone DNA polymerase [Taibaiella sp.]|nr:error-prone DNA polymerase [Taibaiella sp.]